MYYFLPFRSQIPLSSICSECFRPKIISPGHTISKKAMVTFLLSHKLHKRNSLLRDDLKEKSKSLRNNHLGSQDICCYLYTQPI